MEAVFVTSTFGWNLVKITVGSLIIFPSESLPSSLTSLTSFELPGLLAVTRTLLLTLPLSIDC